MIHDIRHIRAFLALARAGSFTRAAAELHMSQPTLTVQIQQLESAVGVKLFDRNKRHVALTQAGRDLLVPLERILIDVEAIATSTEELLEHRRGLVTVAALPSVAAGLLPRAIKKLSESFPGITGPRVRRRGRHGRRDGESRPGRLRHQQPDLRRSRADEPGADHGSAVRGRRAIASARQEAQHELHELAKHPLILMGKDSSSRQIVDLAFDREGLVSNVAYETTYGTSVTGWRRPGLASAFCPSRWPAPSRLHQLRIRGEALTRRIGIIMRAGRSLSPTADKLKQTLESVVAR